MKRVLLIILIGFLSFEGFGQVDGDFRTKQSGNWNEITTWERYNGTSWVDAAVAPDNSNGTISVSTGHVVSIPSGVSVIADQLFILSSATLNILSNGILVLNDGPSNDLTITAASGGRFGIPRGLLNVNGSLVLNDGSTVSNTIANLLIKNEGVLNLNYSVSQGTIPTVTWEIGSTLLITGNTSNGIAPNGFSQNFYNLIWDTPNSSVNFIDLNFQPQVANDFIIENTGTTFLLFSSSSSTTYSIGRDLIINNSSLVDFDYEGNIIINIGRNLIINDNVSLGMAYIANTTVNVAGDLRLNGGVFDIEADEFGGSPNGEGVLNVEGSFVCDGGQFAKSGAGTAQLNFNGTGTIDFTNESSVDINYSFDTNSNYTIITGALSGPGDLLVNDNTTLGISSADGISIGTNSGNIQVEGIRTFGTSLTFIYLGNVAQNLGTGLPSSDFSLEINNSSGVTLSENVTISSNSSLRLIDGSLNIGPYTLTLNGTVNSTGGGLSGGSTSSLTIGGTGPFGTLGFEGTNELANFTIDRTSSGTVTLGGPLTVLGDFNQNNGELILNGNNLTIHEDFMQANDGTITADALSSLTISGSGTLPAQVSLTGDLQTLTFDRASATLATGVSNFNVDALNLFSGILDNSGIITMNAGGNVERRGSGSLTNQLTAAGTYDLVYNNIANISSGPEFPTTATALNNLIKKGSGILTLTSNSTVNGVLDLVNGQFNAGTQIVDLKGDFISNANSVLENSTLTFSGLTNITGTAVPTFGNVTVTGTLNPASDFNINGNLVNNGVLNSSAGVATFGGNTTISGSQPVTFNNVSITNTLTASATQLVTINGNFANTGAFDANGGTLNFAGITNFTGTAPSLANVQINGTVNAPAVLTVSGNFINNNTFNNNSGVLNFAGTGTKSIGGTATTNLFDVNLLDGAIAVNGNVNLANVLTLSAGTNFDADGAGSGIFTLQSSQARDAAIAAIPTAATFSGNLTIQRAIYTLNPENKGYHIVGFPATGISVSELQDNLSITGTFTGKSTGTGFDNNPSLFAYDENINADFTLQERYIAFPNSSNTETFPVGEGYHLYTYAGEAPTTLDGRGVLFTGNFSKNLTFTGVDPDAGWHTIANPYPAPTDWIQWGKSGVQANTAHIYNSATGAYIVYDESGQKLIPQGQGFFVRAAPGGGQVTATETTKVTGSTPVYYRDETPLERFEIVLKTPEYEDISIVNFSEGATDAYEWEYDATRLLNSFETLSTLSIDNEPLKVNGLANTQNSSACSRSIFLNLEQMKNNTDYQLEFRDLEKVGNYQFMLIDHYLDESVAVQANTIITFQVNDDASSKGAERFELLLENNQPNQLSLVGGEVCPEQNAMLQIGTTQSNIAYSIYKDSTLISSFAGTGQALDVTIENSFLILGENDFDVYAKNGACDSVKVGSEVFTLLESLTYDNEVSGSMVCDEETFAPFEIYTQNGANYFILQNNDTLLSFAGNGALYTGQIATADLVDGINTLIVGVEKDGCQSGTLDQNLEITVDALSIDETVSYYGNSTCDISKGKIVINTQDNISYDIFKGGQLVASVTGTGGEVQSDINQNLLSVGTNQFKIVAKYGICASYEFPEMAQITIEPLETPQIIVSGNLLESNIDADSYIWLLNGEILPNETNKILVVTIAGNYSLEINKGDCAASSNSVNISETILSSNDALTNAVNIYPNPVTDILRISVEDVNEIKVTIFTLSGQFVNRYSLKGAENTIDVSRLNKGTYLIQLETDKGNITKRIVKK